MKLITLVLLTLSTLCSAAEFTEIVAFGDSLSDMGNRWIKTSEDQTKIRATWVKQLAAPTRLNIPGFQVSGMKDYLGGTNYAVGGATTEYTAKLGSDRNRDQNLTQQISKRYLNPEFNTAGVKPNALHVVVIGANDLMLASVGLDQIGTHWANLDSVGIAVAQSTEGQIRALALSGVQHVLWGNVFDLAQSTLR